MDRFFKAFLTINIKSAKEIGNTLTAELQRFAPFLKFWLTWAFISEVLANSEGKYTLNYQYNFHSICQLWIFFL